ncbi:MAG: HEAT repeat domain-containing protein [Planctomycetota bacterium]|nr:HEAT repeat domain-containing protein [Planctomycetota bacterium]
MKKGKKVLLLLTVFVLPLSTLSSQQQSPPPYSLDDLINEYNQAKEVEAKRGIISRMGAFKQRRTVDFILSKYPAETDVTLKCDIIYLLSSLDIPESANALADLSYELNDPRMKETFKNALGLLSKSQCWNHYVKSLLQKKKEHYYEAKLFLVELLPSEESKKEETLKILSLLGGEADYRIRKAVIERLSDYDSDAVLSTLGKFLKDSEESVQLLALRVLDDYPISRTMELLLPALDSKFPCVRMRAIEALCEGSSSDKLLKKLVSLVTDDNSEVRKKAVEGLRQLCDTSAITQLIKNIKSATPPQDSYIADALRILTEQDFGRDSIAWENWWKERSKDFRLTPVQRKNLPTFFGTTVASKRIIFVIDVSGSMNEEYKKKDGWSPQTGLPSEDEKGGRKVTKIEMAKKELISAIEKLQRDVKFNIIFYNQQYNAWRQQIIEATYNNKQAAIEFVRHFTAEGRTNIYDTLEFALNDKEVNTIYLLSDGLPNEGKYTDPPVIIEKITELNKAKRVSISTFGFGLIRKGRAFLEELAKKNYGEFYDR